MVKRKIIQINEKKCNGCGLCIPDCPEGALQIVDGKVRLVSDLFCDGLGACIGSCSRGAIKIIEREAEPYDERKVMRRIVKQGENVIKAHLQHLKDHGEEGYLREAINYLEEEGIENPLGGKSSDKQFCDCPSSRAMVFEKKKRRSAVSGNRQESKLRQWPVQLMLLSPNTPYFDDADLVIAADCVPFAYANFHQDFLKDKTLIIGCPKLDDIELYKEKLTQILRFNNVKSVTVAHMEVPCCFGLQSVVEEAIEESGKKIKLVEKVISVQGDIQ